MAPDRHAIRTQQGVSSTTWTRPPFYSDLTLPELFVFHADNSPLHPVFVYDDEQGTPKKLFHSEVFHGIRKAAQVVETHVHLPSLDVALRNTDNLPPVVGVLAVADNITFTTLLAGIMYLGYTAFPISVKNSGVAIAHLVRTGSVRNLVVSDDAATQHIAQVLKGQLSREGYELSLLPMPLFRHLYGSTSG